MNQGHGSDQGRIDSRGSARFSCAGVLTTPAVLAGQRRPVPPPVPRRSRRPVTREVWMRLVYYGLVTPEIAVRVFFSDEGQPAPVGC